MRPQPRSIGQERDGGARDDQEVVQPEEAATDGSVSRRARRVGVRKAAAAVVASTLGPSKLSA
jgi:hypothetical protein